MSAALWALVGVLVAGFLLRAPIGFSMIVSGVAYLAVKGQDIGLVAEQILNSLYNSYVLLAVPLFILAANVMNAGTVSDRIFDFCRILVRRGRGGRQRHDRADHPAVDSAGHLRAGFRRLGRGVVSGGCRARPPDGGSLDAGRTYHSHAP